MFEKELILHITHYCLGDKLEVVSIHGACGEELPLYSRVKATPLATSWLHNLEDILKATVTILMQACVQARMEEGEA